MDIELQPWSAGDLPLLEKLLGDPEMMEHLGGPESLEQIRKRHQRYLHLPEPDHMFKIVWGTEAVGSIGFWEKPWREQLVYETGWSILPAYQGRGLATKAGEALIARARLENRHRFLHAFPSVDNIPSNTICRKLGFTLIEWEKLLQTCRCRWMDLSLGRTSARKTPWAKVENDFMNGCFHRKAMTKKSVMKCSQMLARW